MRRDGTMTVVNVKVERTSKDGHVEKSKATSANAAPVDDVDNETTRLVRIKREKADEQIPKKSNANELTKTASETTDGLKKKSTDSNDSLEIVPIDIHPTIDISDDENATAILCSASKGRKRKESTD